MTMTELCMPLMVGLPQSAQLWWSWKPLSAAQIATIYATWIRTRGASFDALIRDIEAARGITAAS